MRLIIAAISVMLSGVHSMAQDKSCAPIPAAEHMTNDADLYATTAPFSLDKDGILVRDYGAQYNNLGKFHNPLFIATYAMLLHKKWERSGCKDSESLKAFFKQADWLAANGKPRGKTIVWEYPFKNVFFGNEPGWYSGITQSRVASILFRAAAIRGDKTLSDMANAALLPYKIPTSEGGLVVNDGDVIWIEEAPHETGPASNVLNGHISGLQSLVDVGALSGIDFADTIAKAVRAVERDLPRFDAGYISYYSIGKQVNGVRPVANRTDYNRTHVDQLEWLAKYTGKEVFQRWADVFMAYDKREDTMSAKASIDPKGHGPDKATDLGYQFYWSSPLPTWIQSTYPRPVPIIGVHVGSHREDMVARDFSISAQVDGKWEQVAEVRGNTSRSRTFMFDHPVQALALKMEISAAQRKDIVAVDSFSPIRSDISRPVQFSAN